MRNIITYAFILFVFVSCKKENAFDCLKSNGAETIETRQLTGFNVIKVYDKIDLNITRGIEYKVEVKAGKNIISNVHTEVKNEELIIKNENKCNFVRGYKKHITVNVTIPYLKRVENNSVGAVRLINNFVQDSIFLKAENSGDIYFDGAADYIRTSSRGNGDIYLSGQCKMLYVYMFGTNFLYGQDLTVSTYAFVESVSVGNCYVYAPDNGTFEYNLWKSGNIYYRGNPLYINNFSDGSGKGKLIKE